MVKRVREIFYIFYIYIYIFFQTFSVVCANLISSSSSSSSSSFLFLFLFLSLFLFLFLSHHQPTNKKYNPHSQTCQLTYSLTKLTPYIIFMNTIKQINQINQKELNSQTSYKSSWHYDYRDTNYLYIGNIPYNLTTKDLIIIFSQYGIPTHINLIKDKESSKHHRGFGFLKYANFKSCILAIDNFNGIKLGDRYLKVDHNYYKLRGDENEDDYLIDYEEIKREMEEKEKKEKEKKEKRVDNDGRLIEGNKEIKEIEGGEKKEEEEEEDNEEDNDNNDDDEFKDPMAQYLTKTNDKERDDD
ncbi:RNA-binding domain-containing protein, X-linked 2, partial [Candida albicans P37005]